MDGRSLTAIMANDAIAAEEYRIDVYTSVETLDLTLLPTIAYTANSTEERSASMSPRSPFSPVMSDTVIRTHPPKVSAMIAHPLRDTASLKKIIMNSATKNTAVSVSTRHDAIETWFSDSKNAAMCTANTTPDRMLISRSRRSISLNPDLHLQSASGIMISAAKNIL